MRRLLIADGSESYASVLADALCHEFEIRTCTDGETALELLAHFIPDALIISLQLPYKDGLTVLQESPWKPNVILATTNFTTPYIEQCAAALGVSYTMLCPAVNALCVRLTDMVNRQGSLSGSADLTAQAVTHLHILNIPTHLDGYHQLCIGIPLFCSDPQQRITKELYPSIAAECGSKDSRAVEHSIRKTIVAAWKSRNDTVWAKYFPRDAAGHIPCPTNKAFITQIAQVMQMQ